MLEVNREYVDSLADSNEISSMPVDGQQQLGEPLIAVVIPVYKHPDYLQDAVFSVLRQSLRPGIRTVVINDGCPYPSTDEVGRLFHDAYPEELFYLRTSNGGPSCARNCGIRFALDAWPSVQAVFPLDADNLLSPHTIERLWQALVQAPDNTGWVYQDQIIFGNDEFVWHTGVPFSTYRLAHEHFCDTGALIHRRVFDADIFYDEDMKQGYEDWEYHFRAGLEGFKGIHVPGTGFFYRTHGRSRNDGARDTHHEIYQYILQKHADHLQQRLVGIEHDEMPRFAIASHDTDTVTWGTDPCAPPTRTLAISEFIDAIVSWENEPKPKSGCYIPPLTIIASSEMRNLLQRLGMLPGTLFAIQGLAARHDCVRVTCELSDDPFMLNLDRGEPSASSSLIAVPTQTLLNAARYSGDRMRALMRGDAARAGADVILRLGLSHVTHANVDAAHRRLAPVGDALVPSVTEPAIKLLDELWTRLRSTSSANVFVRDESSEHRFITSHAYFASQQLDSGLASFPYRIQAGGNGRQPVNIVIATAWIGLGGVDQIVLKLARELAGWGSSYRVHLVITDKNEIEADPKVLEVFDTITFLATDGPSKQEELLRILAGADIIFNSHSRAAYNALPKLRSKTTAPFVSLLQVIDPNLFGIPTGYPVLASRQYAPLIDYFVVPSRRLKRSCINLGVPEDKILVVPNAPAIEPPTLEDGLALARDKASRTYSAARPLQILFAGRFDEQKGIDRLRPIVDRLEQLGVPFDLRVIGKAVLSSDDPSDLLAGLSVQPPVQEPAALARYYADVDVFLLTSRWEGVPLTVLESMSFGNVVVTTNVGAIDEVVEHGSNGFLVDPDLPEDEIAAKMSKLIAGITLGSISTDELRAEAVRTAMGFTWYDAAERLAALVEPTGLE